MTSGRLTTAALVAIGLMLGSAFSAAQNQITLGGSAQSVTFQGSTGSSTTENVALGKCTSSTCVVGGSAWGQGTLSSSGSYSITSAVNSLTVTLVNMASGLWTFTQSSTINFAYGPSGSLLSGTLDLSNLSQTPGTTAAVAYAALTVTGGSLASLIGTAGVMDVLIKFNTKTNLESLLGTNNSIKGKVSSGALTAAPEPSSILLLGSGLFAAGSMLRFKAKHRSTR